MIDQSGSTLLTAGRPLHRLFQQPLHCATTANSNAQTLLDEPGSLQLVTTTDLTDHVCVSDTDPIEHHGRMTVRIVVSERRIIQR